MNSMANQTVVRLKDFRAGEVSDKVTKALNAFSNQVSGSVQEWRSKARSAAKSTDGFVRTSPWQAVGVIALAGLATGVLVSLSARRARRNSAYDAADGSSEISGG